MVRNIISALRQATDLPIKPLGTTTIENCITYTNYCISDNGGKSVNKLELRLITSTYEEAETYKKIIKNTLIPIGDNVKIQGVTACELNGGGSLYEAGTRTYHTLLYFDYITRSEIKE